MMGAREWLNQHPKVAIGGGITIAVLAIALVVVQVRASRHRYPAAVPNLYFTADDGKTFFVECRQYRWHLTTTGTKPCTHTFLSLGARNL